MNITHIPITIGKTPILDKKLLVLAVKLVPGIWELSNSLYYPPIKFANFSTLRSPLYLYIKPSVSKNKRVGNPFISNLSRKYVFSSQFIAPTFAGND